MQLTKACDASAGMPRPSRSLALMPRRSSMISMPASCRAAAGGMMGSANSTQEVLLAKGLVPAMSIFCVKG